jgi:hypothetical protein
LLALAHLLVWYRRRRGWDLDDSETRSERELGEIKAEGATV